MFFSACITYHSLFKTFRSKKYNCIDWKSNVSVNTFLIKKIHEQYDERSREFALAVKLAASTRQCIKNVGKRITALFGNFPQKTALHAISAGTPDREGYQIEKIIVESFPNHNVTATFTFPMLKKDFLQHYYFAVMKTRQRRTALFSNQIVTLNLYSGIKSYKDILENPIKKNWYSYIINDCLKYYDLPDLINLIEKNKINLLGTTDLLK